MAQPDHEEDMVEECMEIFMDEFSVSGDDFDRWLAEGEEPFAPEVMDVIKKHTWEKFARNPNAAALAMVREFYTHLEDPSNHTGIPCLDILCPSEVPPEVPTDVPPLATHFSPVLEEGQGDTEEFLSSSSFSTTESSDDTPPHFFTDEDFTPTPKQPNHDPIPSPAQSAPPVPTEIPSPPPVPTQQTPMTEQSTPACTSSSKKRYKRISGRILQLSPSPAVVNSRSESLSPPKRHRTRASSQATPPK
ncbi:proline-rich receptor-like protein kinase PERK2 [Hibiscus syriacus]|uniref:proline-rich receptor-like protein kinase PERK2 n=1 Tax=Hibiscus syriacus TaxID=106335 RepID=UPI00192459F9|nr:proline-rich receptor-like protein kinase PERK2 [Hibiscus syriacus]